MNTTDITSEVTMLKVADVKPNDYNPNVVPDNILAQLKKDIDREGIQAPITVRKVGEQYIIIDGEHRYRTAIELGIKEIPCVVKDKNEYEAMLETINMNRLRGEFDSVKLAEVLRKLSEVYSTDELQDFMGYTEEELINYDDLLSFDPESLGDMDDVDLDETIANMSEEDDEMLENEFAVELSLAQLNIVEKTLEAIGGDRGKALELVCKVYLEANFPKVYGKVVGENEDLDKIDKGESVL